MKIKKLQEMIKYVFSAGTSFVLDIALFTLLNWLFHPVLGNISIIVATVISRILSSLYNYFMNSRFVFKTYNNKTLFHYYALVVCQMMLSSLSVYLLNLLLVNQNVTLIKSIVDIIIFVINYLIQKYIIFK